MPRQPRFVIVGHPQHVIIRGNNRGIIFNHRNDYLFCKRELNDTLAQTPYRRYCQRFSRGRTDDATNKERVVRIN
jgi:hypothetical protein